MKLRKEPCASNSTMTVQGAYGGLNCKRSDSARDDILVQAYMTILPGARLRAVFYLTSTSSYSRLPRPIFSAWARQVRYSVLGLVLSKWSCLSWKPGRDISSVSWLPGRGVCLRQASTQAWSSASGSDEANMPTSGMIGVSLPE